MSSFSAPWLALREPLDAASRSLRLGTSLAESLQATRSENSPLAVIDLGAGTGANLRYAAPLIGGPQEWLLVDNEPALLEAAQGLLRTSPLPACRVRCIALDLATQLDRVPLRSGTLLTASALLDLVSEEWLRALVRRAADVAAPVWFTLAYDGHIVCDPAEPEDREIQELFNLHQLTDKGFGAALGPGAGRMAQQILLQHGYQVQGAPSDWHIGPDRAALQHALLEGWCQAATQIAPHRTAALRDWLTRRRAHVDAARSKLRVGHVDMVGHPVGDAAGHKVHNKVVN